MTDVSGRELFSRKVDLKDPLRRKTDTRTESHLNIIAREHVRAHRQMAVFTFDHIGNAINVHGVYEKMELDTLFAWLHAAAPSIFAGAALDVGANVGNHALYFSDHFREVIAFEPNPRVFALLKLNAELAPNITCHAYGASDRDQILPFKVNPFNLGASRVVEGEADASISLRTLDGALAGRTDITFIKLDVESHELQALAGAREIIAANRPIILMEQRPDDFKDGSSAPLEYLRSLGYSRFASLETISDKRVFRMRVLRNLYRIYFNTVRGGRETVHARIVLQEQFEPRFYAGILALPDHLGIG